MGEFFRDRLPDPLSYFEGEGLALTGRGKWRTARCEFHGGSDSLRLNIESGAWVCMSCQEKGGDVLAYTMALHGLEFVDAARSLGAYVDDDKPHRGQSKPGGLSARAALEVLSFECLLTWTAAFNLANGHPLTADDLTRLHTAAVRIKTLADGVLS